MSAFERRKAIRQAKPASTSDASPLHIAAQHRSGSVSWPGLRPGSYNRSKSAYYPTLAMYSKIFAAAVLALGVLATPTAQTTTMPLGRGASGHGRRRPHGVPRHRLEDFKVHVLGVLRNVIGPKRNLILARLEGGPLAKTGVIAGMSGSPVYIDGRLIGAVSYALGQFSTEAIAGITPIAEMLDATRMSAPARGTRPVAMDLPARRAELLDIWARDLGRAHPFVSDPSQALIVSGAAGDLTRVSAMLRPIAVPLIASGLTPGDRSAVAVADRGRLRADVRRPLSRGRIDSHACDTTDRSAASSRRRHGRRTAHRRLRARRHRHGDACRRRSRLRLRPSALQPRADAVPDDPRRRAGRAAEPDVVEQAGQLWRGDRHGAAGSRHRDRRPARRGAVADSGDDHA